MSSKASKSSEDFEGEIYKEDIENISKAYFQIMTFIENEENGLCDKHGLFARFIFNKVKLICTEVPPDTDLTKLFEVINARGVQLRQDEILKAKLLAIVNKDASYKHLTENLSKLWESCADMEGYVAFNLKNQLKGITWKELLQIDKQPEELSEINTGRFNSDFFKKFIIDKFHSDSDQINTFSLKDLLERDIDNVEINQRIDDDNEDKTTSIISFPMLLLHTLRIFLNKNGYNDIRQFNEKKLISIFDESFLKNQVILEDDSNNKAKIVIDFLECLWNVKVIFDDKVVKWIYDEKRNEKTLGFMKLYYTKNKGVEYPKLESLEYSSFTALQAMLYHSQEMITQFWLTPYLAFHYNESSISNNDSFRYLRQLDNRLLSSAQSKADLRERTWGLMLYFKSNDTGLFDANRFLKESVNGLGMKFPHYWFYKLEYVLYHEFLSNENFPSEFVERHPDCTKYKNIEDKECWRAYRITAKNSVEHISPQNPRGEHDKLCDMMLNHFGNLALVTRSINSSYSDNPFNVKKIKFEENVKNKRIDALKLYLVYYNWDGNTWNDISASQHQNDMKNMLERYFYQNI